MSNIDPRTVITEHWETAQYLRLARLEADDLRIRIKQLEATLADLETQPPQQQIMELSD